MAARRGAGPENDEEFLQQLYKGGELLAAGKVIEAKDYLERAHEMAPKNEKGQNLLGLTYFKLGLFERAAEIYEMLVRDNPVDPTLRVNLGLVYLKTNQLARAIREFETSVDLAPEHKKAHNYLGLALAQAGNLAQAREHFVQAGSDAMVQKMDRALSGEATGLHRVPGPLEQQKQGFAEIEGSEIVTERGGQPVVDDARAREQAPATTTPHPDVGAPEEIEVEDVQAADEGPSRGAQSDWGVHFSGDDVAETSEDHANGSGPSVFATAEATAEAQQVLPPQEEELRFAEDEGQGWAEPPSAAPVPPEESFADVDVDGAASSNANAPDATAEGFAAVGGFHVDTTAAQPVVYEGDDTAHQTVGVEAEVMTPEELGGHDDGSPTVTDESAVQPDAIEPHPPRAPVPEMPTGEAWEARPLTELKSEEALGPPLIELAPALEVFKGAVGAPFEVRAGGTAAITVRGELLTRLDGLIFVSGAVQFEPELKRFRGRMTDQPFGAGASRMMRAVGNGVLLVQAGAADRRYVAVDLADESAYFRDEAVFAFEEAVMFENGRVPSESAGDLDLVHLRGKGKVLLQLDGVMRTHPVRMDAPVTVPLRRLVGWFGNVTPKVHALAVEEGRNLVVGGAELTGEGHVLVSVPTFSGWRQES